MKKRCDWAGEDPIYIEYHDNEWGEPIKDDDRLLFEFLSLEGMQAGLSWITILKKRSNFKKAFADFDPEIIARFTDKDVERLLSDSSIVRNRLKILSIINNAKIFLQLQQEFGSFSNYIWCFTENKTIKNSFSDISQIPAKTDLSDKMSKDLKKRGFKFVGSTICYAFMQAVGMVNDHLTYCYKYAKE